jgi:murein DD-endopeptidase MepM/ murein hydrolase activator NlpD
MNRTETVAHHPQRARLRGDSGARRWRVKAALAVTVVSVVAVVGSIAAPAYADYPSWSDVQKAKANQSAATAQVSKINGFIAQLRVDVATTQAAAIKRGQELEVAQAKFDDASIRASVIQKQADESKAKADAAGNGASSQSPDKLLSDLGSMSKLVEQSNKVYADAKTSQNSSKALAEQAKVAKVEREKLRVLAQAALKAAAEAAQAAQVKLKEQQKQIVVMQAQLAALKDKTAKTVAGYQKGVAEAAARAAAAGSGGLPGGYVGPQGWAVPAAGPITDGFGPRVSPGGGVGSTWHMGIDIGAYCNAPIYAAGAGTVEYAGPNGSYGNFVLINNGNGVETGYAHIRDGGILVGMGQTVGAGQPIAHVGTTGASTGCHLHFEVRINGEKIDGIPFMRERQAPLG